MAKSEWIRAVRAKRRKYGNQHMADGQDDYASKSMDGKAKAEAIRSKTLTKQLITAVARNKRKGK